MKTKLQHLPLIAALAFSPLIATAEDSTKPGKASDSVKEPSANPAPRSSTSQADAKTHDKEPGKTSDAVHENASNLGSKFHGKITATDKEAMTVTIEDMQRGSQSLHIGDSTKIKKGESEAKWADLKVGAEIHGTWKKDGGNNHAETVAIGKKD